MRLGVPSSPIVMGRRIVPSVLPPYLLPFMKSGRCSNPCVGFKPFEHFLSCLFPKKRKTILSEGETVNRL